MYKFLFFTLLLISFTGKSQSFIWAKQIISNSAAAKFASCVDTQGNIYTVGNFEGTRDFDPAPGAAVFNLTSSGTSKDIFIQKLDATGAFVWAKKVGASNYDDRAYDLTIDNQNNLYITGIFGSSADFDPDAGVATITSNGLNDVFILKLSSSGSFLWAKNVGGSGNDEATTIAVDDNYNVIVGGSFEGTADFDPSAAVALLNSNGATDAYILKLDNFGNYQWAVSAGSTLGSDALSEIAFDSSNNIIGTGRFSDNVDFDPSINTYSLSTASSVVVNTFIWKLSNAGNFVWAKQIQCPTGVNQPYDISIDEQDNIFIAGRFQNTTDFDPSASTFNITSLGGYDGYLLKLNSSANLVWAKAIGSSSLEEIKSCKVDQYGNIFVTGRFGATTDLDPGAGVYNISSLGGTDVFLQKLDNLGNFISAYSLGSANNEFVFSICADINDNIYLSGYFNNTVDFDFGPGTSNLTSILSDDIYILKVSNCMNAPIISSGISGNVSFCENSAIQNYSIGIVPDANSYTWSLPSGWSGVSSTNSISVTPNSTGGTISITANNACGSSTAQTLNITVNPLPTFSTSATPSSTVCAGTSVTLNGTGPIITYTWSGGVTNGTPFIPSASSSYTVTGTDANGCSNIATQLITVNSLPVVTASVLPSPAICQGTTVTLNGGGANTYSWSGSAPNGSPFVPSGTTTYTVTGTDANGCTNSATQVITVNNLPIINYVQSPSTVCVNASSVSLSPASPIGGVYSGTGVTGTSFDATVAGAGTHTITYIYTDANSCVNSSTQNIYVDLCTDIIETVKDNFSIYPNPSNGVFTIQSNQRIQSIKVYNVIGEIILSNSPNTLQILVDLSNQSNGVYFIRINNATQRVIKN